MISSKGCNHDRHCEERSNPDFTVLGAQRAIQNGSNLRVDLRLRHRWIPTPWLAPGLRMTEDVNGAQ